ncbi:MAG: TonB family protein [Bacteroidales bacterium]|nr:TonB family protein [Bacteroidales bacterium]
MLEEERKKKEQEDAAKKALQDKMNKAFGQNTSGNSGSQGTAGGTGNQGKPDGVAGANNYKGGGSGNGYAWSLDGRGVRGSFPQAKTGIQVEGKVVVEILVDKQGNVIKATPGAKGSTTANEELFKAAQEAAMRAKFTTTESDANWQKGYITYIFDLQ